MARSCARTRSRSHRSRQCRVLPDDWPDFADLLYRGVPRIALRILFVALLADAGAELVEGVEMFAGTMAITLACQARGIIMIPFELLLDEAMNILTNNGMAIAFQLLGRLRRSKGLLWLAPVCSSWVFMCLSQSERHKWNPLGAVGKGFVDDANTMTSRCVVLMVLYNAMGGVWVLEQPRTSLMLFHPRMQWYLRRWPVYSCTFDMGAFGAPSKKPTVLYSNSAEFLKAFAGVRAPTDRTSHQSPTPPCRPKTFISVCLSVCVSFRPSVCTYVCAYACLSVCLSVRLSFRPSVCTWYGCAYICMYVRVYVRMHILMYG